MPVDYVIGRPPQEVTGELLKKNYCDGYYQDSWGNSVYFDETIPDSMKIFFRGHGNKLVVGHGLSIRYLEITLGMDGECSIGDRTEIVSGYFFVSGAGLRIGKDCLLSSDILIFNHDGHHIFDVTTHKRINYAKDVEIEDDVWIGYRAVILPGAKIGKGSVVGANAVTSNEFGAHQIIAGCPAKTLRENVCWSKDNTDYFNHDILEECICRATWNYLR